MGTNCFISASTVPQGMPSNPLGSSTMGTEKTEGAAASIQPRARTKNLILILKAMRILIYSAESVM